MLGVSCEVTTCFSPAPAWAPLFLLGRTGRPCVAELPARKLSRGLARFGAPPDDDVLEARPRDFRHDENLQLKQREPRQEQKVVGVTRADI